MFSELISKDIPPQMNILNIVIPILLHFCSFVSNWSVASRIKLHGIQRTVTYLMTSNCFRHYIVGYTVANFLMLSNQTLCYKIKCIKICNILHSFGYNCIQIQKLVGKGVLVAS